MVGHFEVKGFSTPLSWGPENVDYSIWREGYVSECDFCPEKGTLD